MVFRNSATALTDISPTIIRELELIGRGKKHPVWWRFKLLAAELLLEIRVSIKLRSLSGGESICFWEFKSKEDLTVKEFNWFLRYVYVIVVATEPLSPRGRYLNPCQPSYSASPPWYHFALLNILIAILFSPISFKLAAINSAFPLPFQGLTLFWAWVYCDLCFSITQRLNRIDGYCRMKFIFRLFMSHICLLSSLNFKNKNTRVFSFNRVSTGIRQSGCAENYAKFIKCGTTS